MDLVRTLNIAGLALGFAGTVLVFFFGVPARFSPEESVLLTVGKPTDAETRAFARHKRRGQTGVVLIAVGFAMQFAAALAQP